MSAPFLEEFNVQYSPDKLTKIEFTTGELRKLPSVHAGFLVGSCLAINEITILQRILILASNTPTASGPICNKELQEIADIQFIVLERNLSAKVFEYLRMVDGYKKRCERGNISSMHEFLSEANTVVLKIKNRKGYNLAKWYRNKVTNHYVASEFTSLIEKGNLGEDDTIHPIFLHEKDRNSSYVLGEHVLLAKLYEETEGDNGMIEEYDIFKDWVHDSSEKVRGLHHDFCIQLFDYYLPEKEAEEFSIAPEPHLVAQIKKSCLPILWDFKSS